ncbi:unnamed protein product [Trichogramma brassicae]|uniref:Uncharacterized protein n=1 Tax=Trichogramma brassicae TaxID=86971 RepID=A0A6H5IK58_9HYME|nr:unnamed protein product [Trichogramma brassicae]
MWYVKRQLYAVDGQLPVRLTGVMSDGLKPITKSRHKIVWVNFHSNDLFFRNLFCTDRRKKFSCSHYNLNSSTYGAGLHNFVI